MFGLLTVMGQRSVCSGRGSAVINAALQSLAKLLKSPSSMNIKPSTDATEAKPSSSDRYEKLFAKVSQSGSSGSSGSKCTHTPELEWVLLFLSHCLDALPYAKLTDDTPKPSSESGGRWSWLCAESWLTGDVWGTQRQTAYKRFRCL